MSELTADNILHAFKVIHEAEAPAVPFEGPVPPIQMARKLGDFIKEHTLPAIREGMCGALMDLEDAQEAIKHAVKNKEFDALLGKVITTIGFKLFFISDTQAIVYVSDSHMHGKICNLYFLA